MCMAYYIYIYIYIYEYILVKDEREWERVQIREKGWEGVEFRENEWMNERIEEGKEKYLNFYYVTSITTTDICRRYR